MCRNFSRNIPTGQSTKKYVYHKPSNRIARLVNQYGADVEKITVFIELLSKYKSQDKFVCIMPIGINKKINKLYYGLKQFSLTLIRK